MKNPVIITGATGSMGRVATEAMAAEGYPVVMACNDPDVAEGIKKDILSRIPSASIEIAFLELTSHKAVRTFVENMKGRSYAGLFNNAGVLPRHYSVTEDGIEKTMAVNYLSPCLLTRLMIPYMEEGARIVSMVSLAAKFASVDLNWTERGEKQFGQVSTYSLSKVHLLHFSIALAKKHPELRVNVSDPGIVNSNLIRMDRWFDPLTDILFRPFIHTPEKGAAPAIRALHAEDSMRYFVGKKSDLIPARLTESQLGEKLWDQTTALLGL